jgi:hypothetical protein
MQAGTEIVPTLQAICLKDGTVTAHFGQSRPTVYLPAWKSGPGVLEYGPNGRAGSLSLRLQERENLHQSR